MTIAVDVDDRETVYRCIGCGSVLTLAHTAPHRGGEAFIASHRACTSPACPPGGDDECTRR